MFRICVWRPPRLHHWPGCICATSGSQGFFGRVFLGRVSTREKDRGLKKESKKEAHIRKKRTLYYKKRTCVFSMYGFDVFLCLKKKKEFKKRKKRKLFIKKETVCFPWISSTLCFVSTKEPKKELGITGFFFHCVGGLLSGYFVHCFGVILWFVVSALFHEHPVNMATN